MDKGHVSISAGAILLGALLYCTASFSELAVLLAPVIVHELGHIVALRLFAFAASFFARRTGNEALAVSAGVSLLLSLFNLLPILPLDGGRIFSIAAAELLGGRKGAALTKGLGLVLSTALLMAGTWRMWRGEGTALTLFSLWLLIAQPDKAALVNRKELL